MKILVNLQINNSQDLREVIGFHHNILNQISSSF